MPACECCGQTDLQSAIIGHGQSEEFHQKRREWTMFEYHKARRIELETLSRKLTPDQQVAWPSLIASA